MFKRGFIPSGLDAATVLELQDRARRGRGAILSMTSLAASGHPGGSFSSLEIYLLLWHFANVDPTRPRMPGRDRIVVSHGHTSPGVYVSLADTGFFPVDDAVAHFRQAGSPFEGHVEREVPGVEWGTGNLGQGLSAGVGFAIGARFSGLGWRTFVVMSDGEQHKGQVAEARRLAVRQGLTNLTAVVDLNGIQISGRTADVMPVDVAADYRADGWNVIEVDGHDILALYRAIAEAVAETSAPTAVIAQTIIGKGVSFMEGKAEYHGRALTDDEYVRAMAELGCEPDLERLRLERSLPAETAHLTIGPPALVLAPTLPRTYSREKDTDCRSAWGSALVDIANENPDTPIAVLDCDLAVSVKTDAFAATRPAGFVQCGVGEHNAATVGGALSTCDVLTFWSDFGVFGVDEVYNQQRLNDINQANLKVVVTHCGLDVGEDGKTHQCLDYVGAFRSFFGWRVIVPADPNQMDRAVRTAAAMSGNVAIAMGRSKLPVLLTPEGESLFGGDYAFRYGSITWAREGTDGTILVMGTPAGAAVEAADMHATEGLRIGVAVVACPLDLDDAAMSVAASGGVIVCVEDHTPRTGLFASVAQWVASSSRAVRVVPHGVDAYRSSGAATDLYAAAGLDAPGIADAVRRAIL
ncbi:MAG: transketolase [Actinomycetota bacterium]|nr:transketolase [Actinomycetota bacterium]MDP3630494.1 transketolase [Actinomycetota bacterium]